MQCILHCNKTLILCYSIGRAGSIDKSLFSFYACRVQDACGIHKTLYFTACPLRCTCKLTLAIKPCFYTCVRTRTKTLHASINLLYSTARFALYRTAALSMKLYFYFRLRRAAERSIKPCIRTSASL